MRENHSSPDLFPKWTQRLCLSSLKLEAWVFIHIPFVGGRNPNTWITVHCFPRHIRRELNEWSIQDQNWHWLRLRRMAGSDLAYSTTRPGPRTSVFFNLNLMTSVPTRHPFPLHAIIMSLCSTYFKKCTFRKLAEGEKNRFSIIPHPQWFPCVFATVISVTF